MAVPTKNELRKAVLEIFADSGQSLSRKDIRDAVPTKLELTEDDVASESASGANRVVLRTDWAIQELFDAGFLRRPARGIHEITSVGNAFLHDHTGQEITNAELKPYWEKQSAELSGDQSLLVPTIADHETSPLEQVHEGIAEHEDALKKDLLATTLNGSPDRFERLVLDLLRKMGYGEPEHTGKSGDGGIDGIINQDALGLEKVYVQAKRWSGQVGEPEIRNFSGSLDPYGATKGVFITTSTFSNTARQTAQTISAGNKLIRLVDGNELAQLMIRHGVGVVTEYTYEIKKLDENYFADEF